MPRGATCSRPSKPTTILGQSTPQSLTSPQSRQTGKPHNPLSTVPGEGQTYTVADRRRSGKTSTPGGLTDGHLKCHSNLHQLEGRNPTFRHSATARNGRGRQAPDSFIVQHQAEGGLQKARAIAPAERAR